MSKSTAAILKRVSEVRLSRLGPESPAGLLISSLPCPRAPLGPITLDGRATSCKALGQWPGEPEGTPRRALLIADGGEVAPEELSLSRSRAPVPVTRPPSADAELFERCDELAMMWERHLLRLRWGSRSVGLAMGLRHAGQVHWWECARLVVLETTPTCTTIEMGGAIPRLLFGQAELDKYTGYNNPFVHHHNWINGHIHARLHANGVCEIFAHHINSKFFDDGALLEDVVPVLGIATENPAAHQSLCGAWTGEQTELQVDGVRFDMTEVARLASPQSPGNIALDGRFVVLQPYEGVELFSGGYAREMYGDPFLFKPADRKFPRGMARTLRFSLSLNPQRNPRVARYMAPAWWFGLCEEFTGEPVLPVRSTFDEKLENARAMVRQHMVSSGFEDGSIPRNVEGTPAPDARGRHEAGWEGECPYSIFLLSWRSGDAKDHEQALRAAYYFTDVCIDHAAKLVRMHGYEPHAISLPMSRVQGTIAAWLDTGDPYLLDAASAVIDMSHWTQKNSWPRMAVGRDAKYLRSAVLLYRYTGDTHYKKLAHEGAMMAAHAQRPNGSFGDQAGGTGIHQRAAYVTKPWMASMCLEGVMDYLEFCGSDPVLWRTIERWADWLMKNRWKHANGVTGWSYQHDFNGQNRHYVAQAGKWMELPTPDLWHSDTLARLMYCCAQRDGDWSRLDAWMESYQATKPVRSDHGLAATGQGLPWISDKLWNATLNDQGVRIKPIHFGSRTPGSAEILTPAGPVSVEWDADARVVVSDAAVTVEPATLLAPGPASVGSDA